MPQRGRAVPALAPGKRKQYAPGQLSASLDPVLRQNIEQLALTGYEQKGRGVLLVELDATTDHGIGSAQFYSVAEMKKMAREVPMGDAQPLSQAVATYDPEREFVAMVIDVTPSLPGPQLWFEVFTKIG